MHVAQRGRLGFSDIRSSKEKVCPAERRYCYCEKEITRSVISHENLILLLHVSQEKRVVSIFSFYLL